MIEDDRHIGQAVGMFVAVLEMEMAPKAPESVISISRFAHTVTNGST
jgi:hypothetical protein